MRHYTRTHFKTLRRADAAWKSPRQFWPQSGFETASKDWPRIDAVSMNTYSHPTMILRLSQKLGTKIKAGVLPTEPLGENPFADWSAHLFIADRTQYILLSNTKSLYSTVMFGQGITNDSRFIERALSFIRELLEQDGHAGIYERFITTESTNIQFAKALSRGVTGSMMNWSCLRRTLWHQEKYHRTTWDTNSMIFCCPRLQ